MEQVTVIYHVSKHSTLPLPLLNIHQSTMLVLKFIYSEKATKFCEISTLLLSYVVPVKSKVDISQNFVASSEYMNFNSNIQDQVSKKGIDW